MPDCPPAKGPARRSVSGRLPDSTLSTVAPYSERYLVVIGPTATQQKSSTFSPSNGKSAINLTPKAIFHGYTGCTR